jgi:hypothetical protein
MHLHNNILLISSLSDLPSPHFPTVGRLGTAVGSAAALAVASLAVDASGGKLSGQIIDDGATPPRRVYPYET